MIGLMVPSSTEAVQLIAVKQESYLVQDKTGYHFFMKEFGKSKHVLMDSTLSLNIIELVETESGYELKIELGIDKRERGSISYKIELSDSEGNTQVICASEWDPWIGTNPDVGGFETYCYDIPIADPNGKYYISVSTVYGCGEICSSKGDTYLKMKSSYKEYESFKISLPEPTKPEGGGCLIATAAYGSEMAPQVQFLREIRDNTVLQTQSGTSFMTAFNTFYYTFSPTIADYERENPVFKEAVKIGLTPLLTSLTILNYVDIDTEQEMLGYGIGIIMLNIGMYFVAPAVVIIALKKRFQA